MEKDEKSGSIESLPRVMRGLDCNWQIAPSCQKIQVDIKYDFQSDNRYLTSCIDASAIEFNYDVWPYYPKLDLFFSDGMSIGRDENIFGVWMSKNKCRSYFFQNHF